MLTTNPSSWTDIPDRRCMCPGLHALTSVGYKHEDNCIQSVCKLCSDEFPFQIYINDFDQSDTTFHRVHECFTHAASESVVDQVLSKAFAYFNSNTLVNKIKCK